ncbi:hypothetical protein HT031_005523 [Scenedesmus sp. PABB004]|nr:hypothetical protein HT031_005523 [Scenedesmus sp. PABB004]
MRLLALAVLLGAVAVQGYPLIWTGIATEDCVATPTEQYGPHAAPTADAETALVIKRLGSTVVKMCPGMPHKILANFPEARHYLVTSTQGSFVGVTDKCLNRVVSSTPAPTAELELMLPCDAAGTVKLSIVSASPGPKAYKQLTTSLPVNGLAYCPASPCAGAGVAPARLESGSVGTAQVQAAAPVEAAAPAAEAAAPAVEAAAPAAEAAAPATNVINLDLMNILKQAIAKNAPGAAAAQAAAPAADAPAPAAKPGLPGLPLQGVLGALGGGAGGEGGGPLHALAQLQELQQNVNATQVLILLKSLGKLMPAPGEPINPGNLDIKKVMEFAGQLGKVLPAIPGAQSDVAPDLPTAVMAVVRSMGKLMPGGSGGSVDFIAVLNFLKASGELIGKLAAMRAA